MEYLAKLTQLAFQFGPFMFALLFTLYISRWGYRKYNEVNVRTSPPASDKEKNTMWIYFLASTVLGFILVIVSIYWWFQSQKATYVFTGKISDLSEVEEVVSNELYFKQELLSRLEENLPQKRNELFVFIQNRPFETNQSFRVRYFKQGSKNEESMSINYSPEPEVEYYVDYDTTAQRSVLKPVNQPSAFLMPGMTVYAQDFTQNLSSGSKSILKVDFKDEQIARLQNEGTAVGTKIDILDGLDRLSKEELTPYIETITEKESMITTLLDLSRHTDKELSFKAQKIVDKTSPTISSFLAENLVKSGSSREQATSILFRMEQERAQQILSSIPRASTGAWYPQLSQNISDSSNLKILFPTGSSKGDRYYVKALWDPGNSESVECLTKLFHSSLSHNRSYEEELALMQGKDKDRKTRWVYWYSKSWALSIADGIKKCGAEASFESIKD